MESVQNVSLIHLIIENRCIIRLIPLDERPQVPDLAARKMHIYTYDVRTFGPEIHMWGKSPDMENVLLRILNVRYYVYSEINTLSMNLSYDAGVINEVTGRIENSNMFLMSSR